jgi:hypothetical protein
MDSPEAANVGLAVLAVVTLGLIMFVINAANSVSPTSSTPLRTFTVAPTPTVAPATLDAARAVLDSSKAVTVSVLGDSTGNGDGEWVQLWAKHLGESRPVTLHQWDSVLNAWKPGVEEFGTIGHRVTIYNMSQPGATPAYASARIKVAQPKRPDLLILNYGHNGNTGGQWGFLTSLVAASQGRWPQKVPTVVMLQNPEIGAHAVTAAANMAEVGLWAEANQVPTVNVGKAFIASGRLASLLERPLGVPPLRVHPNAEGYLLWANTVAGALG